MSNSASESYRAAGVDIEAGYQAVERMKSHVARTKIPGVLGGLGGFGGLFAPDLAGIKEPVLVSGVDGVGTKIKLAFLLDKHDTVGIDCVAMCVNDIVCSGARPLFFLDYIACGRNDPARIEAIVAGVAEGCVQAGCALVGGETAEHPGLMSEDEYDLAGFSVGLVDKEKMLDNSRMEPGGALLALPSSGVHSNGFSLVRRVFGLSEMEAGAARAALDTVYPELGESLGDALLRPTRIYVKPLLALLEQLPVWGVSHITGGGFYENIPRMLPPGLSAQIDRAAIKVPPVFDLIAKTGGIPESNMFSTFNMGVGMCVALPARHAEAALGILREAGVEAYRMGELVAGDGEVLL